jgi:two-component system CheB/CheR fusion protein
MIPGVEARLLISDGSFVDVIVSATALFDEQNKPRGAIAAIVDITQRKKSEAYQEVLKHELQHRVKNILATVSSLAARMLKDAPTGQEFSRAFLNRLIAMGGMHDLLSRQNWRGADLRTLIDMALAPYVNAEQSNINLDGPEVVLAAGPATTLGMVLHELATNASKYGALSIPTGHIEASWEIGGTEPQRRLTLSWVARDGPTVRPPEQEGFGVSFVKRSIQYELEGKTELIFDPAGLRCSIELPMRNGGGFDDRDTAADP